MNTNDTSVSGRLYCESLSVSCSGSDVRLYKTQHRETPFTLCVTCIRALQQVLDFQGLRQKNGARKRRGSFGVEGKARPITPGKLRALRAIQDAQGDVRNISPDLVYRLHVGGFLAALSPEEREAAVASRTHARHIRRKLTQLGLDALQTSIADEQ